MRFNPRASIFAGMSRQQLEFALRSAQQAYLELSTGVKVVTANYAQGDGAKAITYSPATLPNLVAMIKELQAQLGIVRHARRPQRFLYR